MTRSKTVLVAFGVVAVAGLAIAIQPVLLKPKLEPLPPVTLDEEPAPEPTPAPVRRAAPAPIASAPAEDRPLPGPGFEGFGRFGPGEFPMVFGEGRGPGGEGWRGEDGRPRWGEGRELTEEERASMRARGEQIRAQMEAQMLRTFDLDGDGVLSDAERQAAREAFETLRGEMQAEMESRMLARFDTDGDGVLSNDERRAMREAMRREGEERRAAMLAEFDLDGDGRLNERERELMRQAQRARDIERRAFRRVDTNGDGVIDAGEAARAVDRVNAGDTSADFNGDGTVDHRDAVFVLELARRGSL
ncbi:MAG: hypothetical protein KIS87_08620 [Phycisphaeraceae bacterium]|nr:hypothetical protein [Phycisphaeraceae bacterium]